MQEIPVVELEDLKVRLGRREILHGITCRLGVSGTGRAVGLLGPNGAGKSTLILTLLGFLRPSAGRARILGLDSRRNMGEARSRIGYMPEGDTVMPELSALDYTRLAAELCGLPPREAIARSHQVLHYVGLGEARYRKLGTFSTGPGIRSYGWNLVTEIIGTFVLVFVVIGFGRQGDASGLASLGALPVALLVIGIGVSLGGPTGYAINPARDLGPRIAHAFLPIKGKGGSDWSYSWVPVVGPIIGGALAAIMWLPAIGPVIGGVIGLVVVLAVGMLGNRGRRMVTSAAAR